MIKNWNYKNLKLDYSSMYSGSNHPSDIDLFYLTRDETLILGEIKNESYNEDNWERQKKILQKIIDNYKKEALYLFIVHDKYVQKGDKSVDVPNCYVKEYYYKGEWRIPQEPLKVKEVLERYNGLRY